MKTLLFEKIMIQGCTYTFAHFPQYTKFITFHQFVKSFLYFFITFFHKNILQF